MTHRTPRTSHHAPRASSLAWAPLALAVLLAHAPVQAGAPRATLTLLPAGDDMLLVQALNDAGQLVGTRFVGDTGRSTASVWSPDRGLVDIDTGPDGSVYSTAINNLGQVVGRLETLGAFVFRPGQGISRLLAPDGSFALGARAINDLGEIVGFDADFRPLAWDAAGQARVLAEQGSVRAINNQGQVLGTRAQDDGGVLRFPAVRWSATGTATLLPVAAGREATASGMNQRGEIVGSAFTTATGENVGMLWRSDLTPTALNGLLSGTALNDAQQVIGVVRDSDFNNRVALWRNGTVTRLDSLPLGGFTPVEAVGINAHAQIAGMGSTAEGDNRSFLLTLHPDWTGGDGAWNDTTGTRWNWAGTGTAAAGVGSAHDVLIDPGRSATITGAAEGRARTLQIGGTTGTVVTLNLSGGTTTLGDGDASLANPSAVRRGGVITGSGRLLVGDTLHVQAGGRIEAGAGQLMQLQADELRNGGRIQVLGTAAAPAELQISGDRHHFTNEAAGQVLVQQGTLRLGGGVQNFGRVSLQSARLLADDEVLNHEDAQLSFTFGESMVDAVIDNRGLLVVSNGARASFHGLIDNPGELRISSGGAANFFGEVLITGSFTGGGDAMFEGGVTLPFGQTVQMGPHTTLAGATLRLVGSADGLGLGDRVDVFDWFTGVEGRFTALTLPSLADGLVWDTSDLYAGGTLAVAAVPEPGTWALWLAGAAALAGLQRRRRANA